MVRALAEATMWRGRVRCSRNDEERNSSYDSCLAQLEFRADSGRRKRLGLRDIRGVPLPCVTIVSTTSNLGLPRSVTSLGQSTSTLVLEGLLHRMTVQQRSAFFPEQNSLFLRT